MAAGSGRTADRRMEWEQKLTQSRHHAGNSGADPYCAHGDGSMVGLAAGAAQHGNDHGDRLAHGTNRAVQWLSIRQLSLYKRPETPDRSATAGHTIGRTIGMVRDIAASMGDCIRYRRPFAVVLSAQWSDRCCLGSIYRPTNGALGLLEMEASKPLFRRTAYQLRRLDYSRKPDQHLGAPLQHDPYNILHPSLSRILYRKLGTANIGSSYLLAHAYIGSGWWNGDGAIHSGVGGDPLKYIWP